MGPQPASVPVEARGALPLLSRLAPLHSAAVAARGHQATSLGIKISIVVDVFSSVPAARRKRQRDGLMAVSSAGRQGGAVGGQLWLCRHPAACLTSAGYRLPCQSVGGSSGAKDQSHSAAIAERHRDQVCERNDPAILASGRVFERRLDGRTQRDPLSAPGTCPMIWQASAAYGRGRRFADGADVGF